MGRVEQRMYRVRRKRKRFWRMALLAVLAVAAAALLLPPGVQQFVTERITAPSPTPVTAGFDQSIVTREVTLPQETWYAIQTGVFSTVEAAQEKAGAYTERGAPGVVVQEGAKWRVFIACYGSEADAAAVRTRLGENQRVETYLYSWVCPELRLRLTGMAGQLDVVEAGLTLVCQTAVQLRDAAIALDAGQMTADDIAQMIAGMDDQLALWAETARNRFGRSVPEIAGSLLSLADAWPARSAALGRASASATALSAELKRQGMGLYDDLIRLREGVQSTQ